MATSIRKRVYEIGITGTIAHRIAHTAVQEGISVDTPLFTQLAEVHVVEAKDILIQVLGVDVEQAARILDGVMTKAKEEVHTFKALGRFNTDGATSVRLECVLEPMIETLLAM